MNYEARPTEYNGVTFRSKSEAIFARGLDIHGYDWWEYEPNNYKLDDGYVPDFIVCSEESGIILIEYKPRQVTNAYFNSLEKKAPICLYDRFGIADEFLLITGSPFNDDEVEMHLLFNYYGINHEVSFNEQCYFLNTKYIKCNNGMFYYDKFSSLFSHWKEAKNYRFDLTHD